MKVQTTLFTPIVRFLNARWERPWFRLSFAVKSWETSYFTRPLGLSLDLNRLEPRRVTLEIGLWWIVIFFLISDHKHLRAQEAKIKAEAEAARQKRNASGEAGQYALTPLHELDPEAEVDATRSLGLPSLEKGTP